MCNPQELANAAKALRDLQAAGKDRTNEIAKRRRSSASFASGRGKASWLLWCALHGLGDGDDTLSTNTIALPTGGVFAEAVSAAQAELGCNDVPASTRFWRLCCHSAAIM